MKLNKFPMNIIQYLLKPNSTGEPKILSTKKLEKIIKKTIIAKIPDISFKYINFRVSDGRSPEGTYIFTEDDKYIYLYTEKGQINEKKELYTIEEVLWNVLDSLLSHIASEYEFANRKDDEDFRRQMFSKQIELFALFGSEFEKRAIEDVREILKKYPYSDTQAYHGY